jgi:hypothetical protein
VPGGEAQRRLGQVVAHPPALTTRINSDRSEQRPVGVELQDRGTDHLAAFPGNEHGLHVVADAVERQAHSLKQGADFRQVPVVRGFDHD